MHERAAEGSAPEATEEPARIAAAGLPLVRGAPLTPAGVLALQRQAGNRHTMALLQRETATAGTTLRTGSKGNEVLRLQMHLNLLDEVKQELEVDSIYGPITTGAVREFQSGHSPLKGTGVADPATLAAIEEARAEDQDQGAIARKIFNLGGKAYERRKFGHAYGFFTKAYEMSGRPGVLFSRAQALRKLGGRRKEAIVLYEAYLATGHGVRDADANAAIADLSTPEKIGDATADDATAKAIFMKGGASYEAGDYAHAADEFDRAAEMSGRAGPVFSEAQALRKLGGRREDAIALYEQYLATGHGVRDADAKKALAELRTPDKTGDDAADEATAKAIFNKGGAFYEAGDYGHAADEFARAAEMSGRAGPVFSEAQALRKLGGRTEDAISLYEQYLATGHGVRDADAQLMIELLTTHGAGPY
jgi:tetratricopeptide (TPR) repeat protein